MSLFGTQLLRYGGPTPLPFGQGEWRWRPDSAITELDGQDELAPAQGILLSMLIGIVIWGNVAVGGYFLLG
ncbi:MAG: hypothetical protein IT555_00745 [Acetobacteraceae bacterium]|nr:hypothetical protein [Acetobacteraceae bacterium]